MIKQEWETSVKFQGHKTNTKGFKCVSCGLKSKLYNDMVWIFSNSQVK